MRYGVEIAGNNVTSKYGYYGKAAAWDVGDVHMKGGAGQMNTIYSCSCYPVVYGNRIREGTA